MDLLTSQGLEGKSLRMQSHLNRYFSHTSPMLSWKVIMGKLSYLVTLLMLPSRTGGSRVLSPHSKLLLVYIDCSYVWYRMSWFYSIPGVQGNVNLFIIIGHCVSCFRLVEPILCAPGRFFNLFFFLNKEKGLHQCCRSFLWSVHMFLQGSKDPRCPGTFLS